MAEHKPPAFLVQGMALFFWGMAASALAFWVGGVVWPGGLRGLMASLGPSIMASFGTFHILAAVCGILLWQWRRHTMPPRRRVLLEGATLYFVLAVVLGMFLNYLLVSTMGSALAPAMPNRM
ncbi:hypothetical protein [Roseicyclus marinus]|uniref:hypothetical protein n=1 Tax=Roseicyclus marinus TaxID=2161673 RepID=UPI00241007FB|nr:hypothetical protein [Roseicyclus marinus]MDG3042670.1 hypothetical protein [Roseicyclus marinus]